MKTSNKILLGTLVGIIVALSSVPITINARYKKGQLVKEVETIDDNIIQHRLSPVKYVQMRELGNVSVSMGDSASLAINRYGDGEVRFHQQGDTLVINGETATGSDKVKQNNRTNKHVAVTLPAGCVVNAAYCNIVAWGTNDTLNAPSIVFEIAETALSMGFYEKSGENNWWQTVTIRAKNNSELQLYDGMHVQLLNLELVKSNFRDNNVQAKAIAVKVDDSSSASWNGSNLKKITFTPKQ